MRKTLITIVGALAVLLLSGGIGLAGENFDLQQGDRDIEVPGQEGRGDVADLAQGEEPFTEALVFRPKPRRLLLSMRPIRIRTLPLGGPSVITICMVAPAHGHLLCARF